MRYFSCLTLGALLALAVPARAQNLFAEPDAFGAGTALTNAYAGITLNHADHNWVINPAFTVLSVTGAASTGARVFGSNDASNATSGNSWRFTVERALRASFAAPASLVKIDFINNDAGTDIGEWKVYSSSNTLLASGLTSGLSGGASQTITINRPSADIAYAVFGGAFSTGDNIALDNLQALSPVPAPEPESGLFVLLGGTLVLLRTKRPRR